MLICRWCGGGMESMESSGDVHDDEEGEGDGEFGEYSE